MMEGKTTVNSVAKTIGAYLIWIILCVSQVGLALMLHYLIVSAAILYSTNAWTPRAVDMWSMVLLGIVILVTIFTTESYVTKGLGLGRFWQRVGKVVLIEAITAALLVGLGFFF